MAARTWSGVTARMRSAKVSISSGGSPRISAVTRASSRRPGSSISEA